MAKLTHAQKFTDLEYLSKKEVADQMGNNIADNIWRQISEYREKYRFPLDVKRFDHIPFSIVLTPNIMGICNETERLMVKFSTQFEKYKIRQDISETKSLDQFRRDVIKEDLYIMSMQKDYRINEKDLDILMDERNAQFQNTPLYGYYCAQKYLAEHPQLPLDKSLFKDLLSRLLRCDLTDEKQVYREQNNIADAADYLAINELMRQLFDFYNGGYAISPFVIASIMFIYVMYVQPFQSFNEEMATLTYMKVLQEAGYGEASYYLSIGEFILQKHGEFISQFEEIKRSGDMTYGVLFLSRLAYDAIEWRCSSLVNLTVPEPSYGNVRVIEKVVEKVVEKEVPVYIEKPVPQTIIEEKRIPAEPTPAKEEKSVAEPAKKEEVAVEEAEDEQPMIQPFVAPEETPRKGGRYEFESDPFLKYEDSKEIETPMIQASETVVCEDLSAPKEEVKPREEVAPEVKVVEKIEESVAPVEKVAEQVSEMKKEEPIPVVEKAPTIPIASAPHDLEFDLDSLEGLEETDYAQRLTEMQPRLKYRQALFYATHRVPGSYYTISQFKKFNECAYETARTSMDFLANIGLYVKRQVKNKFVYTPKLKNEKE